MRSTPLNNRYYLIAAIVAACFALAIAGYILPATPNKAPARVIMDNTGGRVIFTHQFHAEDYGFECTDCHHDDIEAENYLSCGTCHPAEFNVQFRTDHQSSFPNEEACLRCHDDKPAGELSEDERPDIANIPLRADAFHSQCMDCHAENGGPYDDDSCYECHAR